jgi:hypothetical protein
MHTEHLQNVRPVILIAAWLVAFAVTSLILLALVGLQLVDPDEASTRVAIGAVAFGFFVGGAFAGLRARQAPILYGVALGLLSLLIAVVLNVLLSTLLRDFEGGGLAPDVSVTLLLIQIVSAVLGARTGYRFALRGSV